MHLSLLSCATRNPVQEFKHMVDAFHQNGLECLMEFYFEEETSPSEALEIFKILEERISYRWLPSYGKRNLPGSLYERRLSLRNKTFLP